MPIDLEMLLSAANHPLFSYSPFSDNQYDNFAVPSGCRGKLTRSYSFDRKHFLLHPHSKQLNFINKKQVFRACSDDLEFKLKSGDVVSSYETQPRKKKVSFADDKGLSLVEVRMIPDAGIKTPMWADDIVSFLIGTKPTSRQTKTWKPVFSHPPWDDDELVEHLEKNMVVVESLLLSDGANNVFSGKIKVKNLDFQKTVFLRATFDRWVSYSDILASYVSPKSKRKNVRSQYDTFYFRVVIPPAACRYEVVEFCAGFKCGSREYWDNNGGINYRLVVGDSEEKDMCEVSNTTSAPKVTVSLTANFDEFSEIDAWNSFICDRPYW